MKIAKKFETLRLNGYDAYIFSGVWCISAVKNHKPNALYLHTPMRILYDLKQYFLDKSNPLQRIAVKRFIKYWTPKDKTYMNQFDAIAANSGNVKKRVLRYYGRKLYSRTSVVYTGIETKKYRYIRSGDFYLSASRLDTLKRIDMLINAFKKMPNRRLVIAGTGPDETRLRKMAEGLRNIEFIRAVSDDDMRKLYGTCLATIAANKDEDLGLVAIESHASGKPTAVIREGGFLETVNNRNGVFFDNEDGIPKALDKLEHKKWNRKLIQKSASKYDIKVFSRNMVNIIKKL